MVGLPAFSPKQTSFLFKVNLVTYPFFAEYIVPTLFFTGGVFVKGSSLFVLVAAFAVLIPGSMAFFFVFGLVCGRSYFNIRYKKLLTWIPLLSWGYMYTLWPVTSIFNYNSILVAWAGFALCFLMMGRENI